MRGHGRLGLWRLGLWGGGAIGPDLECDVAEDGVALSDGKVAVLQGGDVLVGVELGEGLGLVCPLQQVAPARGQAGLGLGLGPGEVAVVGHRVRGSGGAVVVAHLKAAALGIRREDAGAHGVRRRRHPVDLHRRHDGQLNDGRRCG